MADKTLTNVKGLRQSAPAARLLEELKQAKTNKDPAPELKEEDIMIMDGLPMIMRFPPESYRNVESSRLAEWKKTVETRLGKAIDVSADLGATESFSRDDGKNASFVSDYDADGAARRPIPVRETVRKGQLQAWPSSAPVVLGFPPVLVERVRKPALPGWNDLLREKLGIDGVNFADGGGGETVSWCEEFPYGPGGPKILFTCDCDMDGGGNPVAGRR